MGISRDNIISHERIAQIQADCLRRTSGNIPKADEVHEDDMIGSGSTSGSSEGGRHRGVQKAHTRGASLKRR